MIGGVMKRFVVCLMFVGLMVWPVVGWSQVDTWDAAFEAAPAAGDPVSEGDDHIRQTKENVRYRKEVEHWIGDTGLADDNGLHRIGSARCFMGTAFPVILYDASSDFDNAGGAGEADLDDPATNSAAGDRDDVGDGRCFVDIDGPDDVADTDDDYTMYIYEGAAGAAGCPAPAGADDCWHVVVADSPYEDSDDQILAGSYNLIYNGSFEATDGSGDPASVVVPDGWAVVVGDTPGYAYTNPSTDIRYGDGYHLVLSNTGAANEGMRQTVTNLDANTTYKLIARVQDDGAVGAVVCRLDIVNETATTDFPADSSNAAGPVWETLGGTFTTGAVLTTVDVEIYPIGVAGTNCKLDHFVLWEVGDVGTDRDEITEPGVWQVRGEYTGATLTCGNAYGVGACAEAATGLFIVVTTPSVGTAVILLNASAWLLAEDLENCNARLRNTTTNVTLDETTVGDNLVGTGAGTGQYDKAYLHSSVINQLPGTTSTYALQIEDAAVGGIDHCHLHARYDSWIEAVIIPTR